MSTYVETLTITEDHAVRSSYREFNVEQDGSVLATALVEEYGSKEAVLEEMLYMTIIASARDDKTTLNALSCVRKYWRAQGGQEGKKP